MKHLLILISILLLSSPVIGNNHKGETLYGWGNTLPYVWKGFGDKETHPKYEGDVENGVPNGEGTFTYSDGNKGVGEFRYNKPWNITTYKIHVNIIGKYVNGIKTVMSPLKPTSSSPVSNSH